MLSSPRDPRGDNRLAPCSVPPRKILNRSESSVPCRRGVAAQRAAPTAQERWDLAGRAKNRITCGAIWRRTFEHDRGVDRAEQL